MIRRIFSLFLAFCTLVSLDAGAAKKSFPYKDVKETSENIAATTRAVEKAWMKADSKTTFKPDGEVSLGDALEALASVYMKEADKPKGASRFSGAKKDSPQWTAADWAYKKGLLTDWLREHGGEKKDAKKKIILDLTEACSHKDFINMIHLLQTPIPHKAGLRLSPQLTDVKDGSAAPYYHQAVGWALERNIIPWISKRKFAPNASLKRLEMAIVLYRNELAEQKAAKR